VGGETAGDIETETAWLTGVIEQELASRPAWELGAPAPADSAFVAGITAGLARPAVAFAADPLVLALAEDAAGRAFLEGGPLIPDQIVYAGSAPLMLDDVTGPDIAAATAATATAAAVAGFTSLHGVAPIITIVPGVGLFATGDSDGQTATARDVYLDMVRTGATALRLGGVRHLDARERTFIEHWEAEAYRKQVAAG
jgi:rhamnose utilization protein RhaD (predicted bifunctional aldolase and dehydrogenase)